MAKTYTSFDHRAPYPWLQSTILSSKPKSFLHQTDPSHHLQLHLSFSSSKFFTQSRNNNVFIKYITKDIEVVENISVSDLKEDEQIGNGLE